MSSLHHGLGVLGAATRPVIRGQHMVVASGHHLASLIGMRMLDKGGNAFDAGVAMLFAQSLLEFQSYGFGGEIPMLLYAPREGRVVAVNGNTRAPARATIEEYRRRGVTDIIAGDGLLAAGVPAAPHALLSVLKRYGTLTLEDVLRPAIGLATDGFPLDLTFSESIAMKKDKFASEWPTSAALFLPGGKVPGVGTIWRNPDLAAVWEQLVRAEFDHRHLGRSEALRKAKDVFYKGRIAERIVEWQLENEFRDDTGVVSSGLLSLEDFAEFETRFETPARTNYRGYDVYKCGPWSQGPILLQTLNILEGYDLAGMGFQSGEYLHTVIESLKLAFADREKYYGDPDFSPVPMAGLLSKQYAAERRTLISDRASRELRPGNPYPHEGSDFVPDLTKVTGRAWSGGTTGTRAVDKEGNLFSATPSGGWFHASPIIEGLGFCLGTRLQMFWLGDPAHPAALQPRKQPRTTLTPTLVMKKGGPHMVLGTPGGDQQDQWNLQVFLNLVEFKMNIQAAIDAASFEIEHAPASFYPREAEPGRVKVEGRMPKTARGELTARGHDVVVGSDWSQNFVTGIVFHPETRLMEGGASSRRERMYAIGW